MQFELDNILIDDILFYMENQQGDFLLDTQEGRVISIDDYDGGDEPDFDDEKRFISLPSWRPGDGFRLMGSFTVELRNPVIRQELSAALDRNKGVFRAFKNVLEQYPETEKQWFKYKEQKMKEEVIAWYNSLREEWGLERIGGEPEDTSSLVAEDFILRRGEKSDLEKASALHALCVEEREKRENNILSTIFEGMNPFIFPGEVCFVAENANGDFSGYISAFSVSPLHLQISQLEINPEFRGMGLGEVLLAKLLDNVDRKQTCITIDLPAEHEYFSRVLRLEDFKPCVQRYILNRSS